MFINVQMLLLLDIDEMQAPGPIPWGEILLNDLSQQSPLIPFSNLHQCDRTDLAKKRYLSSFGLPGVGPEPFPKLEGSAYFARAEQRSHGQRLPRHPRPAFGYNGKCVMLKDAKRRGRQTWAKRRKERTNKQQNSRFIIRGVKQGLRVFC